MAPNHSAYPTYIGIYNLYLPPTKHKYKTKFSSHIIVFTPLKLNFIFLSQWTSTCCRIRCLQTRFNTRVFPPLKKIDVLINVYALFYWSPLALVLPKCFTNFLAFTLFLAAIKAASFSLYPHHFTKNSFIIFFLAWGSCNWGCSSTSYSKWYPARSNGGLIGPQCVNFQWF